MPRFLWRAADDDYIQQGTCFAAKRFVAELYLDNPGFGGQKLYRVSGAALTLPALDLRGLTTREVAKLLRVPDPGAIGVDVWMSRSPHLLDEVRARGYLWALVDESYPPGTTTWIWAGDALEEEEPEMERVA